MMTLLDTEQSYVESLRSLLQVTHSFIHFIPSQQLQLPSTRQQFDHRRGA